MTVRRAAVLGRCMGVRRAVGLARETARREGGPGGEGLQAPVQRPLAYTLGPLIHNPQAVEELAARGIAALGEGEIEALGPEGHPLVSGKAVVIRAHGAPPALKERLAALGARLVDATCPRVLASQRRAAAFARQGYSVVIAGDAGHGEVAGIAGYAPGASVAGSPEEARALRLSGKVALLAQTTISREEYEAIRAALAERFPGLEAVDSICPCTAERLSSLEELAAEVEAVVVVGGRNSANTARLLSSAQALGKPAWLVETAAELPAQAFGYGLVGLTAGASTPESLIDEVEAALLRGPRT